MKNLFAAAALATTLFSSAAFATPRAPISQVKAAIRADAIRNGVTNPSKITIKGDSFTVFAKSKFDGMPTPLKTAQNLSVASGTFNKSTGSVTSYSPILRME